MALEILLLEDDPRKKQRLLAFLTNSKELFSRVDTVLCTKDAIRHMKERQYDLFLADVVVPIELGGDISEQNCIQLFENLDENFDDVNSPKFSLPISSSGEISRTVHDFFRGRPWGVLQYEDSNDGSIATIEKIAHFVLLEKSKNEPPGCDIFIITALMEPEFSAIEALPIEWEPLEPLDSSQLIRRGSLDLGRRKLTVASGFSARMGPVAAAVLTTKVLLAFKPRLLIMAGICAGIPGKANIGDVVASEVSWDWQSGKYIDREGDEVFEITPHQLNIDDKARTQLLLLKRDQEFWNSLAELAIKQKLELPKLVLGPIASGSAVLADARVADRIKSQQHKNITGLDMETYAVLASASSTSPTTIAISLKSVCDKGDKQKNDEYQAYAATLSAKTIYRFIEAYAGPLI